MPVDDLYVPDGVFLKCDQGAIITQLIVTPKKHKLYGLVIATETDNLSPQNIVPFGACSSSGNVCVPKATQWKNVHEGATRIEGQKPLLETSYCKCMQGGNIDIFFDRDSALAALEGDKKSRVDKIPLLDNILGFALMGPSAVIYKLAGVDASDVGRGFRKGAKGTWNFLTHDMWQGETWKGMGNAIMTGIVGYMPPMMSQYPSQAEREMMQEWMNTTPEERIANFDKRMNTDLTTTHEAIKQAASDFWDKKIENGTAAESGVMIGEASEFVLELLIGGKGINNVIKAVKGTSAVANLSEKTAKAISTISQFVKTSKLAKFAKSIKGIFKVGNDNWAKISGILRDAVRGKGNFGLGSATITEAEKAGLAWVGTGYKIASDGKTMISSNGLRQYRPPSYKPKLGRTQANFEWRNINEGRWQGNGHLDIIK